jgi:hypothetical protein
MPAFDDPSTVCSKQIAFWPSGSLSSRSWTFLGAFVLLFGISMLPGAVLANDEPAAPKESPSKSDVSGKKETNSNRQKNSAPSRTTAKNPSKKGGKTPAEKVDPEQAEKERQEFLKKPASCSGRN